MRPIQRRRELLSWSLWAIILVALYFALSCSCARVPPKAPELLGDRTLPVSVQMVPPTCANTAEMLKLLAVEIQTMEPRLASGDDLKDIIATAQYVALLKLRDQTHHWRSLNVCEVL